jgi:hypothetical protein
MGLGLMVGFIRLFDTVCDYILQYTVTCAREHTHTHTSSRPCLRCHCMVAASLADIPLTLVTQTVPSFGYQLEDSCRV